MTRTRIPTMAAAILVALVALTGCASGSTKVAAPPTTIDKQAARVAYAQALLIVARDQFQLNRDGVQPQGSPSADYAKAAEALNLITPPVGFELRHRKLVDETLALSSMPQPDSSDFYTPGQNTIDAYAKAEATAETDLTNLAHEADPNTIPR